MSLLTDEDCQRVARAVCELLDQRAEDRRAWIVWVRAWSRAWKEIATAYMADDTLRGWRARTATTRRVPRKG